MEKKAFTKENSTALKGVAILLMMLHHCFATPDRYEGIAVNFAPFGEHAVQILCVTCKICVCLFVFITGYGLYLSASKLFKNDRFSGREVTKWIASRYIKLMSGFWLIAILSYIICQLIDGRTQAKFFADTTINGILEGASRLLMNFFGVEKLFGINEFCPTWWYMSIAILFVLFAPFFTRIFDKWGFIPVLALAYAIPRIFKIPYDTDTFIAFQFTYFSGMLCAKYNILVKAANFKVVKGKLNKPIKFVLMSIISAALFYLYHVLSPTYFYEVRLAVIPTVLIIYFYEFFLDAVVLRKVFYFLGKHSMNIFLTHTFIRATYLNEFVYALDYWWETPIVLLVMSIALSMLIELFKKLIRFDKITAAMLKSTDKTLDRAFAALDKK